MSLNDSCTTLSLAEITAWEYALGIKKEPDNKTDCVVILFFEDFKGNKSTLITDMKLDIDESIEDQIYSMYPNVMDFKWVERDMVE